MQLQTSTHSVYPSRIRFDSAGVASAMQIQSYNRPLVVNAALDLTGAVRVQEIIRKYPCGGPHFTKAPHRTRLLHSILSFTFTVVELLRDFNNFLS